MRVSWYAWLATFVVLLGGCRASLFGPSDAPDESGAKHLVAAVNDLRGLVRPVDTEWTRRERRDFFRRLFLRGLEMGDDEESIIRRHGDLLRELGLLTPSGELRLTDRPSVGLVALGLKAWWRAMRSR